MNNFDDADQIFADWAGPRNCSSPSFGFGRLLLAGPACCNLCKGPPCVDSWHKGNMKLLTNRILAQDPTFIDRVAEARLPLAALVLTMNLTVALEVDIFTWAAYSKMSVTKNSWELEAGADGQPWKDSTHPGLWTLWQLDWTGGLHHQDWLYASEWGAGANIDDFSALFPAPGSGLPDYFTILAGRYCGWVIWKFIRFSSCQLLGNWKISDPCLYPTEISKQALNWK